MAEETTLGDLLSPDKLEALHVILEEDASLLAKLAEGEEDDEDEDECQCENCDNPNMYGSDKCTDCIENQCSCCEGCNDCGTCDCYYCPCCEECTTCGSLCDCLFLCCRHDEQCSTHGGPC